MDVGIASQEPLRSTFDEVEVGGVNSCKQCRYLEFDTLPPSDSHASRGLDIATIQRPQK